jgi:hypothetical protein
VVAQSNRSRFSRVWNVTCKRAVFFTTASTFRFQSELPRNIKTLTLSTLELDIGERYSSTVLLESLIILCYLELSALF